MMSADIGKDIFMFLSKAHKDLAGTSVERVAVQSSFFFQQPESIELQG